MANIDSPIRVPDTFHIIAHRGASGYAPENTMAAFDLAKDMAATEIEFDIQFSQDNQLMICHDPELSRYGHAGKNVADLSMQQLKALDMGAWFNDGDVNSDFVGEKMITLDELFGKFATQFIYHLEIKTPAPGLAAAIHDCIAAHDLAMKVYVTSFHFDALVEFASLETGATKIPLGWLVRENAFTTDNIIRAADAGFTQFCPLATEITSERVAESHKHLAEVRAHRVKTKSTMMQVIETGCDGLTINWP
ncbi:MAG: glycerophosphodiester phosphodiesterase, partial [Rhodospirillales bacterium]